MPTPGRHGVHTPSARLQVGALRGVPERVSRAVRVLDVAPDDQLLEIGCGRGVAVSVIGAALRGGRIVAIDRSATMVRLARERNAEHVAAGRAEFQVTALENASLPFQRFDKVFAINVNLFWAGDGSLGHEVVRRALKPSGALYLFCEAPTAARADAVIQRAAAFLGEHGFAPRVAAAVATGAAAFGYVIARPVTVRQRRGRPPS